MLPTARYETSIRLNRLALTPVKASHAPEMFPILADRRLYRFIEDDSPGSEQALRAKYQKLESRISPDKSELWLNWLVRIMQSDTAIGYVQASVSQCSADIAWVIGTKWQNRGFASEAVVGLVEWLSASEISLIRALINPGNKASQKVAINAGFTNSHLIEANDDVWIFRPT